MKIMYLSYIGYFDDVYIDDISSEIKITLLSMAFGVISIIGGLLTVISRCIECFSSSKTSSNGDKEYFYLDITSKYIQRKHKHSHLLISKGVSRAIKIDEGSVETLSIVQKTNGIHSKVMVNICNDYDLKNYEKLFDTKISENSDTKKALRRELKKVLKVEKIGKVSVEKIKEQNTANDIEIKMTELTAEIET